MILSLGYIETLRLIRLSTINHIKPFSEKLRLHSSKLIYQTLYLHNSIGFKYRVIFFIILSKQIKGKTQNKRIWKRKTKIIILRGTKNGDVEKRL